MTKKREKKKNIAMYLLESIREMLNELLYIVKREANKIVTIIEMCILFFAVKEPNTMLDSVLFTICFFIVIRLTDRVIRKTKNVDDDGIPIPIRRYTAENTDGTIDVFNEGDTPEMLSYIHEVEEYFVRKGKLK